MRTPLFILAILIFSIACNQPAMDTNAEGEKLMQLSREWSRSAGTDSIDKTLSYWADDAIVMEPGYPSIKGKQAIRAMIENTSKIPGFRISWEPLSASVSKSGDMAYLIEQSQVTLNDSLGKPMTMYNKA